MILRNKKEALSGFLTFLLAFTFIPVGIFPHVFDKNIAPQAIVLSAIAIIYGVFILWKKDRFFTTAKVRNGLLFLATAVLFSAFLSGNIVNSFTGDTGRYAGVVSLFSLILVAVFHSQFNARSMEKILVANLIAITSVAIFGILQHFLKFQMPGDQGVNATFGNQDFFAAFLAVTAPLFLYFAVTGSKRIRIVISIAAVLCIYALKLAGPLQSWVDLALTAAGGAIYLVRNKLPRKSLSLNARTFLATTLAVIWAEFIFLIPFLGSKIPVLGNDVQVKIRANFWLAGTQSFFSHPWFGVGPDQYGNYYEAFRTRSDAQTYTNILANDAHSASVQSLATLGIVGVIGLLALLTFVFRSLIIQWDKREIDRKFLFFITLYLFVYLSNSFISPMTFPAKLIFWSVCGWLIGRTYLLNSEDESARTIRWAAAFILIPVIFVSANFAKAQWVYSNTFEDLAAHPNATHNYQFNGYLPCFMYFEGSFQMIKSQGEERIEKLALEQSATNPRCVTARWVLAQIYQNRGDYVRMKPEIYSLVALAPARSDVIKMGMHYVEKMQDRVLLAQLQKNMKRFGLVYIPGAAG